MGLFQRYVRGYARQPMVCDLCGKDITVGDPCVAWSQPALIIKWETEFIDVVGTPETP